MFVQLQTFQPFKIQNPEKFLKFGSKTVHMSFQRKVENKFKNKHDEI